ncbi:hypothetical protein VTI28DRAFT_1305 [Corynascus sepedonium]
MYLVCAQGQKVVRVGQCNAAVPPHTLPNSKSLAVPETIPFGPIIPRSRLGPALPKDLPNGCDFSLPATLRSQGSIQVTIPKTSGGQLTIPRPAKIIFTTATSEKFRVGPRHLDRQAQRIPSGDDNVMPLPIAAPCNLIDTATAAGVQEPLTTTDRPLRETAR